MLRGPPSVFDLPLKSTSKGQTSIVPLLVLSMHIESIHIAADGTQKPVSMSRAQYGTVNLCNVKRFKLVDLSCFAHLFRYQAYQFVCH